MSRSYHKTPNAGCAINKYAKRWARRKTRHSNDTLQHKGYRKQFDSWEIKDYKEIGTSFEAFYAYQLKLAQMFAETPPTRAEARKEYDRMYRHK